MGAGCGSAARPDLCGGRRATGVPTATEGVPFPFNYVLKGLRFPAYSCSKCQYRASEDEFCPVDRAAPTLKELGLITEPYSLCPPEEGPDWAELLSPTGDSYRYRVTHDLCGRTVTACMLGGVLERQPKSQTIGLLVDETGLLRELYLRYFLEDTDALDDLDLECLVKAPLFGGRVERVHGVYLRSLHARHQRDEWETRAQTLGFRIQGKRIGLLCSEIARACDPRRGKKMLAKNRFLFVPFDLSKSLKEQWDDTLPWLDELADYAYRFTKVRRPRRRTNLYRDIFIFLSVAVERRTIFAVANEVFPHEHRLSREKRVRQAVTRIAAVVRAAGINLPDSTAKVVPK